MEKLKLALESLEITSFATADAGRRDRGTVRGAGLSPGCHADTDPQVCGEPTLEGPNYCTGAPCEYTLELTCAGSCVDCPSAAIRAYEDTEIC